MNAPYADALDTVVAVAAEHAADVDQRARFPQEAVQALAETGLLGLTVPTELGGMGLGQSAVAEVVAAVAERCASTGMILTMHLCAMVVLEQAGDRFHPVLADAAAGRHLSTLALSERATRSTFWVSLGQLVEEPDGGVQLDLEKSFVTSAGPANSYVVTAATPGRTDVEDTEIVLVLVENQGVEVLDWWRGSGLRGNSSAPMRFRCRLPQTARIARAREGHAVLATTVIPMFQLGAASVSVGLCRAAAAATRAHLVATRLQHLDSRLIDQPVVRHGLGVLEGHVLGAEGFVRSVARAMEDGCCSQEQMLLVKAVANEAALAATDRAMRLGGGAAYSGRNPVDRLFRDARAGVVMAPTPDMLYEMIGRVAAGQPAL